MKIKLLSIYLIVPVLFMQSQTFEWAKKLGGTNEDVGESLTIDPFGNTYITGSFEGTVDFDPGANTFNLTATGLTDIFICKLNASGTFLWAIKMGGTNMDHGYSITTDAFGNVYTSGFFEGTADFDPAATTFNLTSAGNSDIFISKLDALGNFLWAIRMGGSNSDIGYSIATDASGNVYSTGEFFGTADFNPSSSTNNLTSAGLADIFISKLDTSGNFLWAKKIGGINSDRGRSLVLDASKNIYTTGFFKGTVDFDPGTATSNLSSASGSDDIFINKLDSLGNYLWAKKMGGSLADRGHAISTDAFNNVYTTGRFEGTADFDPSASTFNLTSAGNSDIFISKLDASGNLLWAKRMGGTSFDIGTSLTTVASGSVYTTGYFGGTVDFDPSAATFNLISAGLEDIFISNLNASGNFEWAKKMGGIAIDRGTAIALDNSENVYTTGYFEEIADFDPSAGTSNLTSTGGTDIFVHKMSQCVTTTGIDVQIACNQYTWIDGNTYLENNNNASFTLNNAAGCDSVVTLNLTIHTVDVSVTQNDNTLSANSKGSNYQWLNCNNGNELISGETNQDFTPTSNGNYAVAITQNDCSDTSACFAIIIVGTAEINFASKMLLHPNPTSGRLLIAFGSYYNNLSVSVKNLLGKEVTRIMAVSSNILELAIESENGLYFVEIMSSSGERSLFKVIKQ